MKLADRVIGVHSAGVQSSSKFTIAQNSKMFKILSDYLYSDKIMAVIRELSTNAYDAHIAAHNPNPFLVKLPNYSDPNFTIRDYGTGLSQDDMEGLYKTIGASNKNDSNDFIGCLGLGSKSPFAYSKSFTSTSYFNRMKFVYVASLDEVGEPSLNLFHTEKTNEPNGLEISFAVKSCDYNEFTSKSKRIFHYFKNKPTILGGVCSSLSGHSYSTKNIILSGTGWRICRMGQQSTDFPSVSNNADSRVVAIMGNIAYPVEISKIISEKKQTSDEIAKWNKVFGKNIDILGWERFLTMISGDIYLELDYDIGELDMEPSREGLQYTKDVINKLKIKTQHIFTETQQMISDKIKGATCLLDAIRMYSQLSEVSTGWGTGAQWLDSQGVSHKIGDIDLKYTLGPDKALYVFGYKYTSYRSKRLVYQTDKIYYDTISGKTIGYRSTSKSGSIVFLNCDLNDLEKAKKIALAYSSVHDCYCYLLVDTKDSTQSMEGFDKLISEIGGQNNIKNVSDYKDLIKKTRNPITGVKRGSVSDEDIFVVINHDIDDTVSLNASYGESIQLKGLPQEHLDNLPTTIVYVPINRYRSIANYPPLSKIGSWKHINIFKNTNVYAIKQGSVSDLASDGHNMIDINSYIKEKLDTFKNSSEFDELQTVNCLIQEAGKSCMKSNTYLVNHPNVFVNHMINIFGYDYDKFVTNTDLVNAIDNVILVHYFNKVKISKLSEDFTKFIATLILKHNIPVNNIDKLINLGVTYNEIYFHQYGKQVWDTTKTTKYLMSYNDMSDCIKKELDNSPVMKYIMTMSSDKQSLNVDTVEDVAKNYRDNANHYYGRTRKVEWFEKIDNLNEFRNDIASVIK